MGNILQLNAFAIETLHLSYHRFQPFKIKYVMIFHGDPTTMAVESRGGPGVLTIFTHFLIFLCLSFKQILIIIIIIIFVFLFLCPARAPAPGQYTPLSLL